MSKPFVLFLCTGNSARSQMAEALLREAAGDRFEVHSAGTHPKGVNPFTVRALEELGIETQDLRSKSLTEFLGKAPVRHLIIVCSGADQECPTTWPGNVEREFWPFDDPAAATGSDDEKLATFRQIRDEIRARIDEWLSATEPTRKTL